MPFNQNVSQLKGLLKGGFERSTHWAHAATALFVFATDFLKPLIRHGMWWLVGGALALPMFVGLAVYFRKFSRELGWSIIVFCLVTASFAIGMLGLQYALGEKGEKDGALVALFPDLEGLQEQLFNIAKDVEVVHQTTQRTETKVDALLAQVAREKGVEVAPLRAVLVKLGEKGVADEDIPKKLSNAADELVKLRAENDSLKRGPPQIAAIATDAQSLIDKGEFDAARAVLARGRQAWKESRQSSSRYEAQLLAQEAGIDHLQLAYRSAAAKYGEAASLVASFDIERRKEWLSAQASELLAQGDEFGENAALVEAFGLYRQCLALTSRESAPLDWAATQNNLGIALETLGERDSGTAQLTEAIAAFREALQEYTRARVPLDWAKTQMNLGNALFRVGERESGTARLTEAIAAFREALNEQTRARVPLDWAMTQMNLGNALFRLGEREGGTATLTKAVDAYREALKVRTRERVPLQWARIQTNLGIALWRLGERESGTARLEEAVAAYREALQELTRARAPLLWARTKMYVGNAFKALGDREPGTARLTEAIAAFREALQEFTRERVPLDWAGTQGGLGNALFLLGEREGGTATLTKAVDAYREALKVRTRERVPLDWAGTQEGLGNALRALGARESGTARLEEAVAAYREALQENTRERVPLRWAKSTGNQGVALMLLAERRGDAEMAKLAVQQIDAAFTTSRDGGDAPLAAYFEEQLANARALAETLAKR